MGMAAPSLLDPDRSYTGQSLFNDDSRLHHDHDDADDDNDNEEGNAVADDEGEQRPPECAPKGPTPSFELVSEFFERIAEMRNVGAKRPAGGAAGVAQKKRALVEQMFKRWRSEVGNDLYPLARLILPERDRYRATYGAKEQALAKLYVQVLHLNAKTSVSADRLLKWKQPSRENKASGDFAEVAFGEIGKRSTVERARLTIDEVNKLLDDLSREGKLEGKAKVMAQFNDNLTAKEQKWLIRIILKDLKISLGEKMVLSCMHQDAIDLFNVCSDLRAVAWKLWDPTKRLPTEDNTVQLFGAFRPMLCNRNKNDFEDIVKAMGSSKKQPKEFLIEEKLDGERIQLHKRGEEYRYFSRKDKNYTYLYGVDRTSQDGALTPHIWQCFDSRVEEIILDGEMLAKDPSTGLYLKFGTLKTTAINQWKNEGGATVCFKVFDVLYMKIKDRPARSLIAYPLSERRSVLQKFVTPKTGRLELAEFRTGTSARDIKDRMAWILDKQGEGLVVKNLDSMYTLHGREDDWIKVKPEYMDSLGEEVDVLVMGGFWGSGRRGGTLGSFVCGVMDRTEDGDSRYLSFCKVGSGFTIEDFATIAGKLRGKTREWVRGMQDPSGYVFGVEKPDVWWKPEDSFLLAVKAAEITADALNYGAEVCLRFPRVRKIRWDLSPEDCHRYQVDFLTMASSQKSTKTIADNFTKRKQAATRNPKATILSSMRTADTQGIAREGDVFDGCLFYIIEGFYENGKEVPERKKQELEKLVVANGGKIWATLPKGKACYVICSRMNLIKAKNCAKTVDIIHPRWIVESVAAEAKVPLTREYYISLTPATDKELAALTDESESDEDDNSPAKKSQGTASRAKGRLPMRKAASRVAESPSGESEESDPDLPPIAKKSKTSNGDSQDTRAFSEHRAKEEEEGSETEESDRSTDDEANKPVGQPLFRSMSPRAGSSSPLKSEPESSDDMHARGRIEQSGMGAFTAATVYDEEQIFRHLVFYVDTSSNAQRNGLLTESQDAFTVNVSESDRRLSQAEGQIKEHGGLIVGDLLDPSLTHIIVANDTRRVVELSRRTREPRARRIVMVNWVEESVEAENLQEETFYPAYSA